MTYFTKTTLLLFAITTATVTSSLRVDDTQDGRVAFTPEAIQPVKGY